MSLFIHFLQQTVGQKIITALTGLGLCLFVLVHMLGNLFILSGPEAYNRYAHSLHEFPLFTVFEIGLLLLFVGHIILGILLMLRNKKAKGKGAYKQPTGREKKTPVLHSLIGVQAGVLIVFLIFHLQAFKFGPHYETVMDGEAVRDIYKLVVESFKNPFYTVGYSFVLVVLLAHLLRGFSASFKSLGLSHPSYISLIEKLAWLFSVVVVLGFLIPIWYIFIYL